MSVADGYAGARRAVRQTRGFILVWLAVAGSVGPAVGAEMPDQELQYSLSVGALYSDNIERTPTDEETATVGTAGFDLRAWDEGPRLSYQANSNLNYLNYLDTDLSDQVVGRFDGTATFALVPDRFLWTVRDSFDQTRIDNLSPASPENRQNLNQFATGPQLNLKVGQNLLLQTAARYGRETYETSAADTDRYGGEVRLVRESDAHTTIGIGVSTEHVEPDDSATNVEDYDLNEALAAYRTRTPRTGLAVAAGYGEVDGSSSVSQDDAIVRIDLWRRISPFSSVEINLSQDYSTSALQSLGDSVLSDVIVISEYALAQSDPYRVRLARIHWLSTFPRTRIECGAQRGEEDHSSSTDVNRTLSSVACNMGRKLSPTAIVQVFGGWTSDDVDGATYDSDDDNIVGLGFEWNFARSLTMTIQVARLEQADATENGAWLRLFYAPKGMVQTALGDLAPRW